MKSMLVSLMSLVCAIGVASAQDRPRDPRLRVMPYEEGQVISLDGHLGYQMMIEFDAQERIENVSIGDSLAWQVTPNQAATLLFVKPVLVHAATNMTVVTTRRRYAFALHARETVAPDDQRIIYSLRFTYADEPDAPVAAPASFTFDYETSGVQTLAPLRVFDDGRFTYFQLREGADVPAIFAIGRDGDEELVNSQMQGDAVVVDRIADGFILRNGSDVASVRRTGAVVEAAAAAETNSRRSRMRRGRRP
ncbi:MAG: TrbG/VirB9 family P-type conjugative transfer protein [Hyphomonadaceae bacterium]